MGWNNMNVMPLLKFLPSVSRGECHHSSILSAKAVCAGRLQLTVCMWRDMPSETLAAYAVAANTTKTRIICRHTIIYYLNTIPYHLKTIISAQSFIDSRQSSTISTHFETGNQNEMYWSYCLVAMVPRRTWKILRDIPGAQCFDDVMYISTSQTLYCPVIMSVKSSLSRPESSPLASLLLKSPPLASLLPESPPLRFSLLESLCSSSVLFTLINFAVLTHL